MSFWMNQLTNQFDTKASLQTSVKSKISLKNISKLDPDSKKVCSFPKEYLSKRMSRFTSPGVKASITVEASMAFSLFLFFLVNVFSLIFLFIQYGKQLQNLHQQGKELAVYAYGAEGFSENSDSLIRLRKEEKMESPFSLMAMPSCKMVVQCVVKPWTGYDVTGDWGGGEEEAIVYMAEHGKVYHKSLHCTHLALSIRAASFSRVMEERNRSGGKYTPCEYCGKQSFATLVYLTEQGDRYHFSLGCQGLKRTVRGVYLSQLPEIPACSKCR